MTTTRHPKTKLIAAAVGAAAALAPAVLFFGAGSAQAADISWTPGITVGFPATYESLEIAVTNDNGGPTGACLYTASPEIGPAALAQVPEYKHSFWLNSTPGATAYWKVTNDGPNAPLIPALWTGTVWHVHVQCNGQTAYDNTSVVY